MSSTRPRFLRGLVSLLGVLAAAPPGSEDYWRLVAEQFLYNPAGQ
jgi:hypothetical protein